MIEICMTCGLRKPSGRDWSRDRCRVDSHVGVLTFSDENGKAIADAAKAYHGAREIEDRERAMNDWIAAVDGTGFAGDNADQMELS